LQRLSFYGINELLATSMTGEWKKDYTPFYQTIDYKDYDVA